MGFAHNANTGRTNKVSLHPRSVRQFVESACYDLVPNGPCMVYHANKDGTRGRLIRVQPPFLPARRRHVTAEEYRLLKKIRAA